MPSDVTGTVEVAHALRDVLKTRLASVIVYGSAATGDLLPAYSDLDLLVLVNGALHAEDALRLHAAASRIELGAYAYVQPTFARPESAKPLLVDGSFTVIEGSWPPPNAIQGDDDLRANGEEWLSDLPLLVRRDLIDWSLAAVDVHRRGAARSHSPEACDPRPLRQNRRRADLSVGRPLGRHG